MARCCDQLAFQWVEDGGEGQALVCGGCGSRWEPKGEEVEDSADIKEALSMFRAKLSEKKTWGRGALDDLLLDCLLASSRS